MNTLFRLIPANKVEKWSTSTPRRRKPTFSPQTQHLSNISEISAFRVCTDRCMYIDQLTNISFIKGLPSEGWNSTPPSTPSQLSPWVATA